MRNVKKYWDKLHDDKQLWFQWWQYSGIHLKGANPMREPASIIYLQMVNLCEKLISFITKVGCDGPRISVAERSHPTPRVRGGGREELPHIQGKEQRLSFAGAAVKRYPTSTVRNPSKMVGIERRHQRADRLKPQSQTTSQSDHMDHSLV